MKRSSPASVLAFALALFAISCQQSPPPETPKTANVATPAPAGTDASAGITPADIPAGFGYPGDRNEIQAWADTWQIDKITQHTWNLWAGMTADSGQSYNGSKLPYWETWCGDAEVFGGGCGNVARPGRPFTVARQFTHVSRLKGAPSPPDTQVVAFNKFNPAMAKYLQAKHAGPGQPNPSYQYTSVSSLSALNNAWPSNTATVDRKVEEAPYQPAGAGGAGFAGIETKPVIFLVKASGLTPVPLWQGPAASTRPSNPTPDTWNTCVLLDPAAAGGPDVAPVPATQDQKNQMFTGMPYKCTNYLYAPLATIYSFKMDAAEAEAWNKSQGPGHAASFGTAGDGDYGVLAAMHVNTKEIVDWTWQTFWWQPGQDTPNSFPGSKAGMTANVQGPWRNYAACSAYNQTEGKTSTKMVVCFNPFLETSSGIPSGLSSNCMSCHGTATVAAGSNNSLNSLSYPAGYAKPISFGEGAAPIDPMFAGYTRTDFSWAIPGNAR